MYVFIYNVLLKNKINKNGEKDFEDKVNEEKKNYNFLKIYLPL
jgi:hypothetical protein